MEEVDRGGIEWVYEEEEEEGESEGERYILATHPSSNPSLMREQKSS